jgi:NADH-quinone oxidoreductase subunit L
MMMGLGAGAWTPAVFHIFTHAFFKACLFLCAGSISHSASHHSFDMKKDMGGLRKFMPITFTTWIISTLALCGVFPFSGFFSKDEIIDNVGHNGYNTFMIIGLIGAFMTAAYMTRATYLTFFGTPRGAAAGEHHDEHDAHDAHATTHDAHDPQVPHYEDDSHAASGPHESGLLITVPLIILATLALSSGLLNATPFGESWERIKTWVEPSAAVVMAGSSDGHSAEASGDAVASEDGHSAEASGDAAGEEAHHESPCGSETPKDGVCYAPQLKHAPFAWSKAAVSLIIVFAGLVISWLLCVALYTRKDKRLVGLTQRNAVLRAGYRLLDNKYYLDALYENVIVKAIVGPIAAGAYWFNQRILDGILHAVAGTSRTIAGWVYRNIDQRVVDGAVNNSGKATRGAGGVLQPVQSGKVSQYGALLFSAAAVAALVLVIINT